MIFGDITCISLSETLYQIIILTIGVIAYLWIVSTIGNYVKKETRVLLNIIKIYLYYKKYEYHILK